MSKNKLMSNLWFLFLVCFVFCGLAFAATQVNRVVAVVNKEEILMNDFEKVSQPLIEEYKKKSKDASEDDIKEFRKSVLDEMVNNKLIVQEAKKLKIPVSQRSLSEQINKIKEQFSTEAEFEKQLNEEKLSKKQFEDRIKDQLMAEELTYREVTSKISRTPTEEEIDKTLKAIKNKLMNKDPGKLSDQEKQGVETLGEMVSRYVQQVKAQKKYSEWVENLRTKSSIQINKIEK